MRIQSTFSVILTKMKWKIFTEVNLEKKKKKEKKEKENITNIFPSKFKSLRYIIVVLANNIKAIINHHFLNNLSIPVVKS